MRHTAFFWDERCFWHAGGNYAFTLPLGGLVQPTFGGLPENPETKRRFKNLMEVTGLWRELDTRGADPADFETLARVHPAPFLERFKAVSDDGGGELGLRTPFAAGGFEIAALSAGLATAAVEAVLRGECENAYALSRPPGHHCLPDFPNGFCLLANLAVAIESARAAGLAQRFAVIDWDVHHGNGTEAIFYDRDDVLTISIHQERNYPMDTGDAADRGSGAGRGFNMNIPLPPGAGQVAYLDAFDRLVAPAVTGFEPDIVIIACGFDASAVDPLGRMLCSAETFRLLTRRAMTLADEVCEGRLAMAHEGGYSEVHVPFCGHAVIEEMSGSAIRAPDPLGETITARQPGDRFDGLCAELVDELADLFAAP